MWRASILRCARAVAGGWTPDGGRLVQVLRRGSIGRMSGKGSTSARLLTGLLSGRAVVPVLMLLYIALGFWFLGNDYALNDEGLLTYLYANWASHDLWPVLFFQKAKPVLTLIYMPASLAGIPGFLVLHLVLSSLTLPLLVSLGRALGLGAPNAAAFVVALSPIFLLGGAAGLNNLDGLLGTTLFLYLLVVRRQPLAAGLVLGLLPWVRHELALFSALFFLRGVVVDRRRSFIVGALAFPSLYWLSGALYHGDLIWLVHYPPSTLFPMPGNPMWVPVSSGAVVESLLSITPLIGLAFALPYRELSRIERALLGYVVLWLILSTVLPVWRIANFGYVPRYALQVLPMLALLTARGLESWIQGEPPAFVALLVPVFLAGAFVASGFAHAGAAAPALLATCGALALVHLERGRAAVVVALALVAAGPLLGLKTQVSARELGGGLPAMTDWVRAHSGEVMSADGDEAIRGPIYTNSPLLATHLEGAGGLPGLDVRFMVGVDQYYDLIQMSNEGNGQRQALRRLARGWFYGRGVPPGELSPETMPAGAVFVLRDDQRLPLLMRPEIWDGKVRTVFEGERFKVLRVALDPSQERPIGAQEH